MLLLGTRRKSFDARQVFLPFQAKVILDPARVILWEKSRRIGATWSMAYRAVRRGALMATPNAPKSWFSSADDTASAEYIDYCAFWARQVQVKAELVKECLYDSEQDITSRALILSNRYEIHALTSNAKQFRSKGGDGIWDEAAHHDNPLQMWRAIQALKIWGGSLTILSTHNGPGSLFNRFVQDIKEGKRKGWSLHTTTIHDAVRQGMVDKIDGKRATKKRVEEFLAELREDCYDEETWQQEFICVPIDEGLAFLPYELLYACEREGIMVEDLRNCEGPLYLGMDIGRHKHLTVFFVLEDTNPILVTRKIKILDRRPFREQYDSLKEFMRLPNMRRGALDATGMGEQLAEEAVKEFGEYSIDAVKFSAPVKESLAHGLKREFDDRRILTPGGGPFSDLREDLHSVRRIVSSNGNMRFDVFAPERLGHADRFWAGALAVSAARSQDAAPPFLATKARRRNELEQRRISSAFSDSSFKRDGYGGF